MKMTVSHMIIDHLDLPVPSAYLSLWSIFSIGWSPFFLIFYRSSLCILDIRTLLEVPAELTFSLFLASFFILLIGYFNTESMSILMYSILLVFLIFDYCFLCPV